jgi:hypothetical protein
MDTDPGIEMEPAAAAMRRAFLPGLPGSRTGEVDELIRA